MLAEERATGMKERSGSLMGVLDAVEAIVNKVRERMELK